MGILKREGKFLMALWTANLQAAMEFRGAFLTQVVLMMLNNAAYFIFWIVFFDRFKQVQGWGLSDMYMLFGISAGAFGLGMYLFGNLQSLSDVISKGQLDYYLSLPRPVLLHALASRSVPSGLGDFFYGILSFVAARQFSVDALLRFLLGLVLGMVVFISFMVLVHSLSFYMGNAGLFGQQTFNAFITFALYPINLFEGGARFLLYFILPAAFMGSVPAGFVRTASPLVLLEMLAAALVTGILAVVVFHRGLRRYESGSAINIQM